MNGKTQKKHALWLHPILYLFPLRAKRCTIHRQRCPLLAFAPLESKIQYCPDLGQVLFQMRHGAIRN